MSRRYWLFKTEPDVFGWDHLLACPSETTPWDGVRNYQARNLLRDEIKVGDLGFFYHSRVNPPHIAGVVEVTRSGYPDPTQFDPKEKYFDPKSSPDAPRWFVVDVQACYRLIRTVSLPELKEAPELQDMKLVQRGSRLSVQPVRPKEWEAVLARAKIPAASLASK